MAAEKLVFDRLKKNVILQINSEKEEMHQQKKRQGSRLATEKNQYRSQ